jgi:hypothetical protein
LRQGFATTNAAEIHQRGSLARKRPILRIRFALSANRLEPPGQRRQHPEFLSTKGVFNGPSRYRRRRPIMRRSLSLGLLLVALSALPAVAGHGGGTHFSFRSHARFAGHFNHFNGFSRFNNFNGSFGSFGFNSFGFNRFNRFNRFGSSGFGWGWGDWADWDGAGYGGPSGMVIVLAAPPPAAYAPPPPPAKATVETEAGVTVFRGPGSHHMR